MITKLHLSVFIVTYSALNSELGFCEVSYTCSFNQPQPSALVWYSPDMVSFHIQNPPYTKQIFFRKNSHLSDIHPVSMSTCDHSCTPSPCPPPGLLASQLGSSAPAAGLSSSRSRTWATEPRQPAPAHSLCLCQSTCHRVSLSEVQPTEKICLKSLCPGQVGRIGCCHGLSSSSLSPEVWCSEACSVA